MSKPKYTVINRSTGVSIVVTADKAELIVARGEGYYSSNGLRQVILKTIQPRHSAREWRKTPCYDPDTKSMIPTMQLVPLNSHLDRRNRHNKKV